MPLITRGVPDYIRSDNGIRFTATTVHGWQSRVDVKTLLFEPGSPWENRDNESLTGKLRNKLLNAEIFETLLETKVLIERWRPCLGRNKREYFNWGHSWGKASEGYSLCPAGPMRGWFCRSS